MQPYGIDRQDENCCFRHSKFARGHNGTRRSMQAYRGGRRYAHKRARARVRQQIIGELSRE